MRQTLLLLLITIITSCSGIYTPDQKFMDNYTPKVVVRGILCPDSIVKIELRWSKKLGDLAETYAPVNGAQIVITEDGQPFFSGVTVDGVVQKEIYPKVGKQYNLFVQVEGQNEITASTTIPENSDLQYTTRCKDKSEGMSYSRGYILMDISQIYPAKNIRSIWFRTKEIYELSDGKFNSELFTNNPFVDQINCESDTRDVQYRESNKNFSPGFVRVPRSSFGLLTPFTLAVEVWWDSDIWVPDGSEDEWGRPGGEYIPNPMTHIALVAITPSDDYDKFCRSAYKQLASMANVSPFLNDIVSVYANVKNGLGIFAGYNQNAVKVAIDNPAKQ